MRRMVIALLSAVMSISIRAAQPTDWTGTFSTVATNRYADGTAVRDGEYYAIVWRDGSVPFEGFKEGTDLSARKIIMKKDALVVNTNNAQLVYALPTATNGCMPSLAYTFQSQKLKPFTSGRFSIYLLDTRRYGNPTVTYGVDGNVASVTTNVLSGCGSVQGFAETVGYVYVAGAKDVAVSGDTEGKSYLLSTIDNKVVINPFISDMRVEENFVVLKVKSTMSNVAYNAVAAENITDVKDRVGTHAVAPVSGAASVEDEIEIRIPRTPGAQSEFFNIIRNPMN